MSPLEAVYVAAIFFVGLPSAIRLKGFIPHVRNPVAFAMVATWFGCRLLYSMAHPTKDEQLIATVLSDCVVIAAMFVKEDWRWCPYQNGWHQLACLWHERTPWDKAILCIFPVVWIFYAPLLDDFWQYLVLWSLSMAQLALAGWEGFQPIAAGNGQTPRAADDRPPGLEFTAWGWGHV